MLVPTGYSDDRLHLRLEAYVGNLRKRWNAPQRRYLLLVGDAGFEAAASAVRRQCDRVQEIFEPCRIRAVGLISA